ncbi:8-oxoguanine deaminase [Falsiroseomonas bella]|uniref:8-oxoguanine deaminase n=1 Tax=Falsiroseomonas bella TaxID=2184016 RepID=A0A317F7T6_9PROT|nr:8-oxoguanine deaminase [Falsiroseomonas bella]PWS34815.1 8-oxoguanine deaminase [Falsiroseomonas bella]
MASGLLLRKAEVVVTMDATRRELRGGWVHMVGDAIAALGDAATPPPKAAETLDLTGHVLMPGLVNTHHHMFQSLTRALPAAQDAELFDWLSALYPVWSRLTPDALRIAATTAMAELMLSGCTTASDHHYIFPNGCRLDDTIEAAATIGLRFHATRGAMSLGQSQGGLPPDAVVEDEQEILRDMERVAARFHDAAPRSMLRIGIAPCSPFSVTRELMRDAADFARARGLRLHTHLAENDKDIDFTRERFRCTPAEYAEELGWVGPDVWHAHCVKLDAPGIALFARTGTGVAHCPCSNMRLASGIAPIPAMRAAGVLVGLGVDGSASNDAGHLLGEARQAMLLARVGHGPAAMTAREALEIATLGGARVLGRDDIGALAPGMAADLVAFDLGALDHAGAHHDPVAALVFCTPARAALSVINGRIVVREGRLLTLDERAHAAAHREAARRLAE